MSTLKKPSGANAGVDVLIVEDSVRMRESLVRGLTAAGFTVDQVADGLEACARLDIITYEHVVLDLGLPRKDGLAVLDHLRYRADRPRVLVISGRDHVSDRVNALNKGADDYLAKPFPFDELLARLHALSRRPRKVKPLNVSIGALHLDPLTGLVEWSGRSIKLPPRQFALLELLVRHRGRIFTPLEILDRLSGTESNVSDKSVKVTVFGLKRRLASEGIIDLIETRRGLGYLIR